MAKKDLDRRIQRTRKVLMSTFVDLVLTRGYESVTAAEICRKADLGRSTFYLHYRGKRQLLAESMRNPSARIAACVDGGVTAQQLVPLLDHFREQYSVNQAFFKDPIRSLWVRGLADLIRPRLRPATSVGKLRVPSSLLALTIAEMQIGLIVHWLAGRFAVKSEDAAAMLIAGTCALASVR